MNPIEISEYQPADQAYFEKFNCSWITRYFQLEPPDQYVLCNPEESILKPGGAILMAKYNGIPAGTVALRKIDDTTFEFTKMAVDEAFQRKGIAEALSYASIQKAKQLGAKSIILYTNSVLKPAIHLYNKLGFKSIPTGNAEYKRADIKMAIEL